MYYTPDIKSADAVFVYDYCYIQWWIASIHADDKSFPSEKAVNGYRELSQLRRYWLGVRSVPCFTVSLPARI